jgi:hypothetical protein
MKNKGRGRRQILTVLVFVAIYMLILGPGPAHANEGDSIKGETISIEIVRNTAGYDTSLMPDNGIPAVDGGVSQDSGQQNDDNRSTASKIWGATVGLVAAPISMVSNVIGDATGKLSSAMVTWASGFVQGFLLSTVLNGLNWSLNHLIQLMTTNPNLYTGATTINPAAGPSMSQTANLTLDYTYIPRYFEVVRSISFWLTMIFVLISGVKIIAGSMSGTGSWHAKKVIPRVVLAVIGGFAGLTICQWLIDLNSSVVMDIMHGMNLYETPGIKGFYDVLNKYGGMASTIVLLLGLVMIVMIIILWCMYIIRFNAIVILAIMSPLAFACAVLDETQFISFTWFKVFIGLLWMNFFHALCIVVFKAVFFSRMDALLCCLNALALLYLMLKLPGLFLRSADAAGGAHRPVINHTKRVVQAAGTAAAAAV